MESTMQVRDADGRYELTDNAEVIGASVYRDAGPRRIFTHTEIDAGYAGRGLASQLVQFALDDVRAQGRRVVALCPMVAAFIAKHPDYEDLVDRPAGVDAPKRP